jgi:hypothetical protein
VSWRTKEGIKRRQNTFICKISCNVWYNAINITETPIPSKLGYQEKAAWYASLSRSPTGSILFCK